VDISTSDDAAVYKLRDDLAVVQTVDFFTPIADDPYDFGAISAANSFSDIYAMGAKPLFALNIVGFPTHRLPLDVLDRILKGALDKATEAGVSIIGEVGVSACTDVTGFGFLGHLREMTAGAGVDAEVFFDQVPVLKAAQRFAGANVIPGGTRDNLAYVKPHVNWEGGISEVHKLLLADAQTSGGLLIAVPMEKLDSLVQALETRNVETIAHVGQFTRPGAGKISVLRPKEHRA